MPPEKTVSVKNERKYLLIALLITSLLVFLGLALYQLNNKSNSTRQSTLTNSQPNPTANWKTYRDTDLSFKYPLAWKVTGTQIEGTNLRVVIDIVDRSSTIMSECMQLTSTKTRISNWTQSGLVVKFFSRVTTGIMCSTTDETPREIWIVPSEGATAPGISYRYSLPNETEAKKIFDQILSTFRFLDPPKL